MIQIISDMGTCLSAGLRETQGGAAPGLPWSSGDGEDGDRLAVKLFGECL
jgi:hypothetical protein